MKRNTRFAVALLSLVLAISLAVSVWITPATAAAPAEKLSDETGRNSAEITLSDGTKTGAVWSEILVSGSTYGENREVNMVEFDLANTNLSVEVLNSGTYMVDVKNLDKAATDYNTANPGKTVLAAVNGDLWMTAVHSGSTVSTKVLKVPRGVLILDGEIWASQQIDQENLGATNAEKGTPAGNKAAFGVTSKNQPLVGSPDIRISMEVNGQTVKADGLNRLPALNALIVYNHRVNDTNYALKDAYEVELKVDDTSAFKAGGELTAKVVAVYKAGAATRPAIGEKTIVLTARGNRVADLQNNFKVGDTVTFKTEMTDRMGRTELWQDVQEAIGGHMQPIIDGKLAVANGDTTAYPASFVGYRDDGSVVFCSMTSTLDGSRAGLRFKDGYKFCTEMGFNSVFYLDGGGSATFITLEEGSYTIRNKCSDGSARAVINGIAVVWNNEKVCDKQGSLSYIKTAVDMSAIPATYMDGALINELIGGQNAVNTGYDETEKAFKMTTATATNDPYATLDFGALAPASADEYKYLVFKVKNDHTSPSTTLQLFYAAGADNGADGNRTKSASVKSGMDGWQYVTVDMSKVAKWTGKINNIRLDIFDGSNTPEGKTMYFGAIVLCKTAEEAAKVSEGWAPEGSITDYLAYLDSLKPETEPETEPVTEPVTEAPTAAPETEAPTVAPETQAPEVPTEAPTAAPETQAPAEGGCASAVAFGLTGILMAAAVLLIRKKD
ncbi:MAG: phosphodiester glycosidase family protein [Clostridia bacterium]|nr:phosphodiester glycosidase family protein [Clostridia bacterium]